MVHTFKESLDSSHLLHHLSKLCVLGEQFLNFPLAGTRPPGHPAGSPRLLSEQLGPLRVIQLCEGWRRWQSDKRYDKGAKVSHNDYRTAKVWLFVFKCVTETQRLSRKGSITIITTLHNIIHSVLFLYDLFRTIINGWWSLPNYILN